MTQSQSLLRLSFRILLGGALFLIMSDPAYAQGNSQLFGSMTSFLEALQDLLTGTWAKVIAIIAIVVVGFSWMTGRLSWPVAFSTIGGIILVFSAAGIVDGIEGSLGN